MPIGDADHAMHHAMLEMNSAFSEWDFFHRSLHSIKSAALRQSFSSMFMTACPTLVGNTCASTDMSVLLHWLSTVRLFASLYAACELSSTPPAGVTCSAGSFPGKSLSRHCVQRS